MWETLELNEQIISCEEVVIDKDKSEYVGYIIKTKSQTIEVLLDPFNTCHEKTTKIDVLLDTLNSFSERLDCILCNNVFNYKKEPLSTKIIENKYLKTVHIEALNLNFPGINVVLTMENNEKYYIVLYNNHNGYYPHSYNISWNGFTDTGRV